MILCGRSQLRGKDYVGYAPVIQRPALILRRTTEAMRPASGSMGTIYFRIFGKVNCRFSVPSRTSAMSEPSATSRLVYL
ncbi:MAG: hypothetical protein KatS3mg106_469 [Gemmataceae bacterium]|jgi:hypothetical protein|nr:MAG: hypothetical protein KatS3mg106_469 [Gemmataceae bacterium]